MPTLIELSPEESERLGVSQLFEVPAPSNGERHPEFIRRPGEEWDWNGNHNYVSTGAHKESGSYRFARRATPAEIAAQAPSVGRDELVEVCKKVEAWLYRLAAQADKQAEDTRFPSLVEASKADAKNYRAVATELRHAIAAALAAAGKGE